MTALSNEVAQLESDRQSLIVLCATLARLQFGTDLKVWRGHDRAFFIGDGSGEAGSEIPLSQDTANEIVCLANGITVSGKR
jgi:hypothetical protein